MVAADPSGRALGWRKTAAGRLHAGAGQRQDASAGSSWLSAARAFPPRVHSPFRGCVRRNTATVCWCLWDLLAPGHSGGARHATSLLRQRMRLTPPSQRPGYGGWGVGSALRPCLLCSHRGSRPLPGQAVLPTCARGVTRAVCLPPSCRSHHRSSRGHPGAHPPTPQPGPRRDRHPRADQNPTDGSLRDSE
jgi:hypothetical protein